MQLASRLTVIVSQAASRDSTVSDLEETLVGELLMTDGMDANLIGPLDTMAADSTDCLCISGFRGSLAVLSWLDTDQLRTAWERLGLGGEVRKFGDPPTQRGVRSVVHFQMRPGVTVQELTALMSKLQSDMSVKTVGIAGIPIAKEAPNPVAQQSAVQVPQPSRERPILHAGAAARARDSRELRDAEEEDFPQLDQLVDDFDASDI